VKGINAQLTHAWKYEAGLVQRAFIITDDDISPQEDRTPNPNHFELSSNVTSPPKLICNQHNTMLKHSIALETGLKLECHSTLVVLKVKEKQGGRIKKEPHQRFQPSVSQLLRRNLKHQQSKNNHFSSLTS